MKSEKENFYRLIKKIHVIPAIMGLFITFCAVVVIAIIVFGGVVSYFTESGLESEYKAVQYMAKLYENSGKDSVKDLLDKEGRDYFILNESEEERADDLKEEQIENIISKYGAVYIEELLDKYKKDKKNLTDSELEGKYRNGEKEDFECVINYYKEKKQYYNTAINTDNVLLCKSDAADIYTGTYRWGMVTSLGLKENVKVYLLDNNEILEIESSNTLLDDNKLSIYNFKMFKLVWKTIWNSIFNKDSDENIYSGNADTNTKIISLPYWISVKLENGESFVGRAEYEIKYREALIVFVFVILLMLVFLILFIVLLSKIIRRVFRQRKLLSVFFTDVVTKGHNWMWFTIKGEQQLRKKKNDKLNFAILDISFVKYNTFCVCHSVEEGQKVLEKINRMLLKTLNKHEAFAHHGISSFAVIMQYADEERLKGKVKFILKHLQTVDPNHKFAFHVGIALLPAIATPYGKYVRRDNISIEKIYNNACAATATLESSDDSAIAFFDDKLVEEQKWIDIVNEKQQQALDNEEFVIYYQPKYDPATDKLRGAEALIRWQSPDYGFVTPGRIIPIFEKNGFITEIDHYMITHVARDQKRWLDQGFKCVPVSVNVSRAHFIESDLAEQIRDAVDKEGAPRALIEIELTESAFFDDKKALISTIEKLKSYGFSVSMDDFGAGYSSLNSLKDMPLDVLKLDADFFRGDSEGGRGEIVVSEAIKLAKALNMRTVAEGVEVRDQVDFLAKQGCDMIQGYYYAKPMAGADYELRMGMYSDDEPAESVLELTDSATDVVVENTVADTVIGIEDVTDGMSVDITDADTVVTDIHNNIQSDIQEQVYDSVQNDVMKTNEVTENISEVVNSKIEDTTENVIEEVDGEVTEQDSISEIIDDKTKE